MSGLGVIEKKALGALIAMSNEDGLVTTTSRNLALKMGYKATGGAISFALKSLEMRNYIERIENNKYRVFI